MRIEILIFGIISFLIYNAYYDGKYTKILLSYKKHYKTAFYIILAIGAYAIYKKSPEQGKNMLLSLNNNTKIIPFDKQTIDMLSPIFDFTGKNNFIDKMNNPNQNLYSREILFSQQPTINGQTGIKQKRSVSETKKKYIASNQNWKCGNCKNQLDHTFEIDHKIRLEYGGSNNVQNLIALCRNCHGRKTANENM